MMDWFRESIHYAKNQPALAITSILVVVLLIAVGVLSVRISLLIGDLRQETQDRIQLTCNMSFANGQALLDTAAEEEEVPPEIVEIYRSNLQRYTNAEIRKFAPEFQCEIPKD